MIRHHAILALFVTIFAATIVHAGTITIEIDGSSATTELDFGAPLGRILSIHVAGELQIVDKQFHCTLIDGPHTVCHSRPFDGSIDLFVGLSAMSGGRETSIWLLSSGTFDKAMPLTEGDQDLMFADGTGTFGIEIFTDPWSHECNDDVSTMCTYSEQVTDPGSVNFTPPLTLTIEFEDIVPTERRTWGAIKSIYR